MWVIQKYPLINMLYVQFRMKAHTMKMSENRVRHLLFVNIHMNALKIQEAWWSTRIIAQFTHKLENHLLHLILKCNVHSISLVQFFKAKQSAVSLNFNWKFKLNNLFWIGLRKKTVFFKFVSILQFKSISNSIAFLNP